MHVIRPCFDQVDPKNFLVNYNFLCRQINSFLQDFSYPFLKQLPHNLQLLGMEVVHLFSLLFVLKHCTVHCRAPWTIHRFYWVPVMFQTDQVWCSTFHQGDTLLRCSSHHHSTAQCGKRGIHVHQYLLLDWHHNSLIFHLLSLPLGQSLPYPKNHLLHPQCLPMWGL